MKPTRALQDNLSPFGATPSLEVQAISMVLWRVWLGLLISLSAVASFGIPVPILLDKPREQT